LKQNDLLNFSETEEESKEAESEEFKSED